MSKFFVIVDPESTDAFIDTVDEVPKAYESEAEAIAAAKNYSVFCYVVKAVVAITPVERHKVTKLA
jgi:hypothetical protein